MSQTPEERPGGTRDCCADFSGDCSRRDFMRAGVAAAAVSGGGLGAFYFGYGASVPSPVRVGVIGTGDEGSVLLGAINPKYVEVKAIADIRPYNVYRAFHGEIGQPARPGMMKVYGWKSEDEARRHVKVYGPWQEMLANARRDGLEAIIIALPLFLHAAVAIAAMRNGLHVLTEKLMGHTVHECKEMARVADDTRRHLVTGHQRHYNVLYAQAADQIKRGMLGDLHFIRAQWHRSNMPGKDSWQQPLPPGVKGKELAKRLGELEKSRKAAGAEDFDRLDQQVRQLKAQIADYVLHTGGLANGLPSLAELDGTAAGDMIQKICELGAGKGKGKGRPAEQLGYEAMKVTNAAGDDIYDRPAIEELIRWRLWDRTAAGLMAELGSHQLDAASIFISAAHGGEKKIHPLSVVAAGNRPIFPPDRDCEDHVYCILEFPAPHYDPADPQAAKKKIGVMYSSINGNGFGGYGEIVMGTKGTLILEREQVLHEPSKAAEIRVTGGGAGPTLDTQASGAAKQMTSAGGAQNVSRGYAEEIEHFAWCVRNPSPENIPRCHPKVALGDAVIALVTNMAAREGRRIEFDEAWFDPAKPETPEGVEPDLTRYKA